MSNLLSIVYKRQLKNCLEVIYSTWQLKNRTNTQNMKLILKFLFITALVLILHQDYEHLLWL